MSELFVQNIPSIQEQEFKYRSVMNSHSLNTLQKQSFDDILDLFNKANRLQKQLYEMNSTTKVEADCYTKKIQELSLELQMLTEHYNNLVRDPEAYKLKTKYAYEATTDEDDYAAIIDKNTNDIISNIASSTSKTKLYDETYDETLVAPNLQVLIGPDDFVVNENIYSIEDSDINNMFDGLNDTIWYRKVVTSTAINSIENEIVIGLPEDIVTSRLTNQIVIKPFPVGYLDILDIQYKSNGAWERIPGFEKHEDVKEYSDVDTFGNTYTYNCIKNCGNIKLNFPNIQTNQLKIKFRQRNYEFDELNNRKTWYLGFRDINVSYNIYTNDYSEFDMVYEFTEKDNNIKIYDTNIYFNNSNTVDDSNYGITKEYYYFDDNDIAHKMSSSCPFILTGHKLKVKFLMEGNQQTPNIHKCVVKYKLT